MREQGEESGDGQWSVPGKPVRAGKTDANPVHTARLREGYRRLHFPCSSTKPAWHLPPVLRQHILRGEILAPPRPADDPRATSLRAPMASAGSYRLARKQYLWSIRFGSPAGAIHRTALN